jgi:PAS domain S-box-containing protein
VLAIASTLLVAILALRLASTDASNGILALQVIPIALVALELGLGPALVFAAAACGTVVIWDFAESIHLSPVGYLSRAAVFFPIAVVVGWIAGRLRVALEVSDTRQARLGAIVEHSTDALVSSDVEGRIAAWNPAAERTFGWRSDEVIGKTLAEVTMPEPVRGLYREGLTSFLKDGDRSMIGSRFEAAGLHRDGHEFPIEIAISAVEESGDWVFHAFMHDISERKREEDERQRLASIVESSNDAIMSFTRDGQITSWNPGAERIYGYSGSEALGMTLFDFVPPDRPDDVPALLKRVESGERIHDVEVERIGKGGRHIEVAVTVAPITNSSGRVVAGAAIHRDIAERRRREHYLAAQHRATSILAHAPEVEEVGGAILPLVADAGSWLCAAYWSTEGQRMRCESVWTAPFTRQPVSPIRVGADSEQEDGDTELQWLTGDAAAKGLPSGERAARGGLRTQLWAPILVGSELYGALHFFDRRQRERDDELVTALTAITDQVGNYLQRRLVEQEAERSKDEFFSLVSHELRTPLTSIIGYAELFADSESHLLSEQGRSFLGVIHRNAQRELRLVGDLLLLVRIQEGSFRVEFDTVDLKRVVEQSVEAARLTAAKRGIELEATTDSAPVCAGDAHRLGQVVDNLLSNAIKFAPKGGDVGVSLGAQNGIAAIEVSDSGEGIPEEEQQRLFERLYRSPSASAARIPGVGLGLTIVKAIVDAHAGRVTVRSATGAGTTFRVELPLQRPTPPTEEAAQ